MHGRRRTRKKNLSQAGWQIVTESRNEEKKVQLVLRKPDGESVTVEASSRPRAYAKAELETKKK